MKFGQDVTGMSDPSLGAASHIRTPTADASGLIMMGTLAEMGREAWHGYNKSQLDADIKKIVTDKEAQDKEYMASIAPMAEVAAVEKGLQLAWDTTSEEELAQLSPEEFWKQQGEVEQIQTTNTAKLEKYKAAYEQGMMTADQMVQRVNAATKAAIARQPGLAHELVREAAFYQDLAGVSDLITAQRAFEKSQKEYIDEVRKSENKLLEKYGRPINVVGEQRAIYLYDARKMEYNEKVYDSVLKQYQVLEAEGKADTRIVDRMTTSPEFNQTITDGILGVGRTISSNLKANAYVEKYKGAGLSQVDANIRGISEAFTEHRMALSAMYSRGGEQSKAQLGLAIKQLDEQEKLYKDIAQGGLVAEAATKRLQAAEAAAKLPTVSLEHRIGITNQILAAQEKIFNMTMERPDPVAFGQMVAPLMTETNRYLTMGGTSPLTYVDPKTKQGQMQQAFLFSSQDPNGDPYRKPEEVIVENSRNMENNLKMLEGVTDPVVFMQHFDAWAKTVVEESLRSGEPIANRYSAETVTKVNKFFADMMGNAKTTGSIAYNPANNSFTVLNPDKTPNQERTARVNTMWKAAVSFNGLKADGDIDKQGQLLVRYTEGPLAIKSKQDADDALFAKRITKQEYDYIVKEVAGNKPVISPKKEEPAAIPKKAKSIDEINAARYMREREANAQATREALSNATTQTLDNLFSVGTGLWEAISETAKATGQTVQDVIKAEQDYRKRVRGELPTAHQKAIADVEKNLKANETALRISKQRGETDQRYLQDLEEAIKRDKELLGK